MINASYFAKVRTFLTFIFYATGFRKICYNQNIFSKNLFHFIATFLNNLFGRPVVFQADVSMRRHAAEEERQSKDHRYSLNNGDFSDMDDDVRRRMTVSFVPLMLWNIESSNFS